MSGVATEVVQGQVSTVSIAASIFNLKKIWNVTKDLPVVRDVNSAGTNFTFGGRNHSFDITIEATTPDLSTIDAWTDPGSDGDLTELAIIVSLPPVGGGATVTASFNTKIHHAEMGHPSEEGKVLVRLSGVIVCLMQTMTQNFSP